MFLSAALHKFSRSAATGAGLSHWNSGCHCECSMQTLHYLRRACFFFFLHYKGEGGFSEDQHWSTLSSRAALWSFQSLCRVQESIKNSLRRWRHRQNSTLKYLPVGPACIQHAQLSTKGAAVAWFKLVWKHSGEVGGWHHSTLQNNKCLGVGPCSSTHIRTRTYTLRYVYAHALLLLLIIIIHLSIATASVTRAREHTEHFLTRNNAGCPEETSEMLCFWFPTSNGGSGGAGEPMVGQDLGMLWQDLGAEFEQHHYLKGECAIHVRCCKSTITSDTQSVYTFSVSCFHYMGTICYIN